MNYITLDTQRTCVRGYHLAILNQMRWKKKVNVPYFLFKEMEKAAEDFQKGRTKFILHQGLFLVVAKHMAKKRVDGGRSRAY